jgi:ABC-type oligopeptide transport system substrate-binding subunit
MNVLSTQTSSIGMVGKYTEDSLPDEILSKISNGLLYVNEDGSFLPVLASSWDVSKDKLVYTFYIRKDILWNDNTFFKANDINYHFTDVKSKPIGDYKIQFTLTKPLAIFPVYLSKPLIKYPLNGVGGLYKVNRIKHSGDHITELYLTPNKKDLAPIVYKFYTAESLMINAYKSGDINQMRVSRKTVADMFTGWKNSTITRTVDYSNLFTLFFNYRNPLLKENDVRNAIDMAIDRSKLANYGFEARTSIPPNSWAFNSDMKKRVFDMAYLSRGLLKNTKRQLTPQS